MTTSRKGDDQIWVDQRQSMSSSGPSGATDRQVERERKFDDEGGDQPQAPSQSAVDAELHQAVSETHGEPRQSGQDQWRTATSMGSEGRPHDERGQQEGPARYETQNRSANPRRQAFRHQMGR